MVLSIQLNDEATLAEFVWGNNTLLRYQLTNILNGSAERLLYLWGNHGCGKSHLLQGCCHAINATKTAIYLPLQWLSQLHTNVLDGIEGQALICLDDVEAIATNQAFEEALFHLYNRVRDNNKTILIITGNRPPSKLPLKLSDLRSRLGWGLVMQVHELDDEDKIQTLKMHAKKRGFILPDDVCNLLLKRCARNMHDLLTLLAQLDDASLAEQRKITVPFVKKILGI